MCVCVGQRQKEKDSVVLIKEESRPTTSMLATVGSSQPRGRSSVERQRESSTERAATSQSQLQALLVLPRHFSWPFFTEYRYRYRHTCTSAHYIGYVASLSGLGGTPMLGSDGDVFTRHACTSINMFVVVQLQEKENVLLFFLNLVAQQHLPKLSVVFTGSSVDTGQDDVDHYILE